MNIIVEWMLSQLFFRVFEDFTFDYIINGIAMAERWTKALQKRWETFSTKLQSAWRGVDVSSLSFCDHILYICTKWHDAKATHPSAHPPACLLSCARNEKLNLIWIFLIARNKSLLLVFPYNSHSSHGRWEALLLAYEKLIKMPEQSVYSHHSERCVCVCVRCAHTSRTPNTNFQDELPI